MTISEKQRLESLYRIARALHDQNLDVRRTLQTILAMTGEAVSAQHGAVVTFDDSDTVTDAYVLGTSGDAEAERTLWNLLIERGLAGFVRHSQRTITLRDLRTDPRWPHLPDTPLLPRAGSAVGLPLEKNGRALGVLILIHPDVDYFDRDLLDLLEAVANIASAAIGNAFEFSSARASTERYQWLFSESIVPIILTTRSGQIIDANREACRFLGYEREQIQRLPITAVHRMGTGPVGTSRFESLRLGEEVAFRTTAWTAAGADIPVQVRARRITLGKQELIEWVEHDITAQLGLEQLRADLTAMVYHDLRGPLHTATSSFSALGRLLASSSTPAVLDLIQVGLRSARQLTRMVDSLLDIQRIEEGHAVLDRKQTSMHNLLAEAAELVHPLASEAAQRLMFDLGDDLPFLNIDGDMIQRVIINLLENAVKYTPNGGRITLGAKLEASGVRISVSDSGPGIPPHMQRQIFDKFNRVRYSDAPKGVGLGLAFCRLAIEAHGGRIWVESEPGQGSVFCFTLPLEPQPAPAWT
jgi:PAS domain S-box-containing protein